MEIAPPFRLYVAHTRFSMPRETKGPAARILVFDTFLVVGRSDPLLVGWPDAHLQPDDSAALGDLVDRLATLGRVEGHASHFGLGLFMPDDEARDRRPE
jgi:hypothetical protein